MNWKERLDRISRSAADPAGNPDRHIIGPTEFRIGRGFSYMLISPGPEGDSKIESHVEGRNNPGFTFGSSKSELRTGEELRITTDLHKTVWGSGKSINPRFEHQAPNIVHYYRPMVANMGEFGMLSKLFGGFGL